MLRIYPYVDVPPRISKRIGKRGYVPGIGTVNGRPMRAIQLTAVRKRG